MSEFSDLRKESSGHESAARVVASNDLFGALNEILIRHGENIYRLRITKQGKLILNK